MHLSKCFSFPGKRGNYSTLCSRSPVNIYFINREEINYLGVMTGSSVHSSKGE